MVKKPLSVLCQIGLDFFEFLKETDRASITNRIELRDIYNTEFRDRWADHVASDICMYNSFINVSEIIYFFARVCVFVCVLGMQESKIQALVQSFMPWKCPTK